MIQIKSTLSANVVKETLLNMPLGQNPICLFGKIINRSKHNPMQFNFFNIDGEWITYRYLGDAVESILKANQHC